MKQIYRALLIGAITLTSAVASYAQAPIIQPGDRTSGQSQSTLTLAENGKALLPIIIATDASQSIREKATYLAEKLNKLSGANFEVVTGRAPSGSGSRGIVLGTIAQFPVASLQKPLEIRRVLDGVDIKNGVEAFGIRTEATRVLLIGGGEPGVAHAAARFLELLGYRRFYPAPEWEVAPRQSTLVFNRNETDRPTILARNIWYAHGLAGDPVTLKNAANKDRAKLDLAAWYRQNRLGEAFRVFAAHNYAPIGAALKDEIAANPEMRVLLNGERSPRGVCTSHPVVRATAAKLAVAYFEKHPNADMYSMERGDGTATCGCPLCQAKGSESNRVFGLANEVAKVVAKSHPGKMIGVLAYNTHDVPPDFELEPNVHVQVARLFIQSKRPFLDLVEEWSKKTSNLGIYDYFSTYQWGQDRIRNLGVGGPTANLAILRNDIPFVASKGALSLWSESSVSWGAHGRGNYISTRLMWNPQADVDALLQDFYDKAFGPAAPAMKHYFERMDGGNQTVDRAFFAAAAKDVEEAATAAASHPGVLARLDHIKQFVYYNYLNLKFAENKDKAARKDITFELLKHEFRTRYTYFTHWGGRANYLTDTARANGEPSWAPPNWKDVYYANQEKRDLPAPPWQVEDYTREESEARFREAVDYFNAR